MTSLIIIKDEICALAKQIKMVAQVLDSIILGFMTMAL